ncbi:ATPase [Siphonobacter sp. BAB-5405]|uniref:AAA family ATPase n=1 Tax=Siphonobacter sp. BAB-5405 TaxID=1864825 RepID=UPI000C7F9FCD|nr:AAA family ATPase [Siphonobacter sp. BAB-5405]PMD94697.1 ATPase [Siphonobacter sp. BAB-5405]
MITYLKIDGFKSFQDFEMTFTPFTVIAGTNASGKSNLFDALQLLSRLAETDLKTAFNEQRGNASELFTQLEGEWFASEMKFEAHMLVNRTVKDRWGGQVDLKYTRLHYILHIKKIQNNKGYDDIVVSYEQLENLKHNEDKWVKEHIELKYREAWRPKVDKGRRGTPYIMTDYVNDFPRIIVPQDGTPGGNKKTFPANYASQTVLSSISSVDFPHVYAAKEEMRSWKFLQLNPEDLREPSRQELGLTDIITSSGKNLAAALYRIKLSDEYSLKEISRKLNNILPNLVAVEVYDDKANRQYIIKVKGEDGREFSSRVLSEGTLRLLTLCILQFDEEYTGLLCFEEPENGIHPFRIRAMANLLKDLSTDFSETGNPLRQVIINTHSPVLVGQLIQWKEDSNVTIWLSSLNTLITTIQDKRLKIKVTSIDLASKSNQYDLNFDNKKRLFTLNEIEKYLRTADTENALSALR